MAQYIQYDPEHPIGPEEFGAVYALMERAFPISERRTAAGQEALLSNPAYRLTVRREKDGAITGFFAWWALEGFRYGEHFAVDESLRGGGIGGEMLHLLAGAGELFVLEVEPPKTDLSARRIGFYQRNGFRLNSAPYWQPPLRPGMKPIPLIVMSKPGVLSPERFEAVRASVYRTVYGYTGTPEELARQAQRQE